MDSSNYLPVNTRHKRFIDKTGEVHGRLTIIKLLGKRASSNKPYWLCRCECGNECEVSAANLVSEHTLSCGCLRTEIIIQTKTTHGRRHTKEYQAWCACKGRCYNPNVDRYAHYGGRGIQVCAGWRNDFQAFFEDLGCAPTPKHSIDRVNVNGNYSCGHCAECKANGWVANVKWSTPSEQSNNMTRNRSLVYEGKEYTLSELARYAGIQREVFRDRIDRHGWTLEKAVRTPVR